MIDWGLGHPVENDYYQLTHGRLAGPLIIGMSYFAIIVELITNLSFNLSGS